MKEGAPEPIPEEINFHEVARQRVGLRKLKRETPETFAPEIEEDLTEVEEKAKRFPTEPRVGHGKDGLDIKSFDISKAKERLKADKKKAEQSLEVDKKAIETEIPKFSEIGSLQKKLEDAKSFEMTLLHRKRNDPYAKTLDSILATVSKEKISLASKLEEVERENPLSFRAHNLVSYKVGLREEGHIAETPSVANSLDEISRRIIVGKPMFLHGPTGTGKTSLARLAARRMSGKSSEMVYCNPQTRESHIWGKTGIRPTEGGAIETVDIFGPLAKAMQEGKVIIFDEFTALPAEQMVFIKGILNAKVGDEVNVVGNGKITIAPGFQMIFTANLKSEKNPLRQALPPEIAREFEQNNLEIAYTPKEEAYDIILARLMNPDGSVDMSVYDLDVTLPKLCEAMEEIQLAYTDRESEETARLTGTLTVGGEAPGLKKLVLTQGTVEAIIDAWKAEKQINPNHASFAEFLDSRFQTTLTFKEYPEADRVLAAKILASKGFLRTRSEKSLSLPDKSLEFDKAVRENTAGLKELREKSKKEIHHNLTEVSKLDPFEVRGKRIQEAVKDLLGEEDKEEEIIEKSEVADSNLTDFLSSTYKGWGVKSEKVDAITWGEVAISPANENYSSRKDDVDASKYGEYTVNPDTVGINWDTIPEAKINIVTLPEDMNGKSLAEVGEYIKSTYGSKYKMPGLEYYKYILENPTKAPASLKDGKYYFFYGSLFRYSSGHWNVPYVFGSASGFRRRGLTLDFGWGSSYRVVLLEN